MKSYANKLVHIGAVVLSMVLLAGSAVAVAEVSVSGFIRQETAYKLSSDENPYNQHGNVMNGKTITNTFGTEVTRTIESKENDWNLMATRAELDFQLNFSNNWTGFVKLRGFFENGVYVDHEDPNFFEVPFHGDCATVLEVCGEKYMVDLPAAYLDYNKGGFWLRLGNQQIAWGEALFFRVADVVNGLDLRRHSFLDFASEEYADERVPGLGFRGSYRFSAEWELEFFAQQFNPTIYANENTPYNVIGAQFAVHQEEGFNAVDDAWNSGLRLRAQLGDLGLQFFAVSRRNPDGVFRWTESNINPFAGIGDPYYEALGALLAQTAFEMSPEGVWTADEWFTYAGMVRADAVAGLDAAILDFPAAQVLKGFPVGGDPWGVCAGIPGPLGPIDNDRDCAYFELDLFYDQVVGPGLGGGLGPLRGHVLREFPYENVFGFGFNYMIFAQPESFFDQMVVRFETSFTPDKKFTNIGFNREYIEEDEWVASLIIEKYHRFSQSFPATFMVLEYMYRSEADMFGRHLSGMDNENGIPNGEDSFHAIAFALQQPFPDLIWRLDLSILYDLNGGYLIQPGIRWKPNAAVTVEAFANLIDSDGGNDDIMETFEWADEFSLRIGYQF